MCAQCDSFRREIADLREEVAAWRGYRKSGALDDTQRIECAELREHVGCTPCAIRLLHYMIAHPGRMFTYESLLEVVALNDPEERSFKLVHVRICNLRKALAARGLPDAFVTHRSFGYSIKPEVAQALAGMVRGRMAA